MNVGIIGYGTIGCALANAISAGRAGRSLLVAVMDVLEEPPFDQEIGEATYINDIDAFLALDMDVVVEAASQSALKKYGVKILQTGHDLVAMSVGALVDDSFLEDLRLIARKTGSNVYIPSGAIGGLDALSAAAMEDIESVSLTTTKPVGALQGASSANDPDLDLDSIVNPTCIYSGTAEEAVSKFPKSINVAAALSLVGVGFRQTTVRIVADPDAKYNSHRIEAMGKFGELSMELVLRPSPSNPRTSHLAALSAIKTVKRLTDPIKFGV